MEVVDEPMALDRHGAGSRTSGVRDVPLRREPRNLCLRFPARRDRGWRGRGQGQGCPDQAAASRSVTAGVGVQFHGSSSARRWAGWDAMRPSTSASQA